MLLSGSPFVFVIDLAALASRREYLKLDKWLRDKLKEHQVTSFLHKFVINAKVNLSNTVMWLPQVREKTSSSRSGKSRGISLCVRENFSL